ncbi:MAG: GntR family transcriptional regulator [Alphaproteobacteria bacterium]|nr:MAG: GntR family transcriptional regulator [Alphaproteobacteria bacterium]
MPEDDTGAPRRPPRYREILEIIRGRIRAGAYPVGGNLPSEAEFCAEFGSSRFTVREALRRLQAEGLVSRQQGAGSRVLRRTPAGRYVQAYGSLTELLQLARDTGFRRISLRHLAPPPDIAPRIGAAPGECWARLRGLRLEGPEARPVALVESWIPPRLAHLAPRLARGRPPFYRVLEEESGEVITDVVQETEALAMPGHVAAVLGAAAGAVALRLLRRYTTGRGTLIASFNWHHGGDRFIHRTHLRLTGGG